MGFDSLVSRALGVLSKVEKVTRRNHLANLKIVERSTEKPSSWGQHLEQGFEPGIVRQGLGLAFGTRIQG